MLRLYLFVSLSLSEYLCFSQTPLLRLNRQLSTYTDNEITGPEYVSYDTFGGSTPATKYQPYINKIGSHAERRDFIRYLKHVISDDEAPEASKENPYQSYETLKKSKFFSPRRSDQTEFASPPGKRQIRFYQCYFNPISCFRKRSVQE